ncbi:MAG: AAA family ATPase [Actinomycetota bacterium]|nr:AAA family ATPase [Actinomycetota bacterium]
MTLVEAPRTEGSRSPSHEAERRLVGAAISDRTLRLEALGLVEPTQFTNAVLSTTWGAIRDLECAGRPVEVVALADQLAVAGVEGDVISRLRSLPQEATLDDIRSWAAVVADHAVRRDARGQLLEACGRLVEGRDLVSVERRLESALSLLLGVDDSRRRGPVLASEAMDNAVAAHGISSPIASLGYPSLDDAVLTLRTSLVVLGGRPSMGKTSLALGCALRVARSGAPALFFSSEMSETELIWRLLSMLAHVPYAKLLHGKVHAAEMDRIRRAGEELVGLPLYIDDRTPLSAAYVELTASRLRQRIGRPLGLAVIDYVQLFEQRGDNRTAELSAEMRRLKVMPKRIETPVLALSQISRNVESRSDKHPRLEDLKDTGAIEESADVVLLAYREGAYNPTPGPDVLEVEVAKARNSQPGAVVRFGWRGDFTDAIDPQEVSSD